jgi:hypothetical protein
VIVTVDTNRFDPLVIVPAALLGREIDDILSRTIPPDRRDTIAERAKERCLVGEPYFLATHEDSM